MGDEVRIKAHWMTSARMDKERELIDDMEFFDTGLGDADWGNYRIFLLPFIMASMGNNQLYKDAKNEAKVPTATCVVEPFAFSSSLVLVGSVISSSFIVSTFTFSNLTSPRRGSRVLFRLPPVSAFLQKKASCFPERPIVYVFAYFTIVGNVLVVYRSLFSDRRFAWGHFFSNTVSKHCFC